MNILILTIGLTFLWHFLVVKILPFLSGMMDSESGATPHLILLAVLPLSILIYLIYEKYDTTDANISLALSAFIFFTGIKILRRKVNIFIYHPSINIAYNVFYTIILFIFLDSLLP